MRCRFCDVDLTPPRRLGISDLFIIRKNIYKATHCKKTGLYPVVYRVTLLN